MKKYLLLICGIVGISISCIGQNSIDIKPLNSSTQPVFKPNVTIETINPTAIPPVTVSTPFKPIPSLMSDLLNTNKEYIEKGYEVFYGETCFTGGRYSGASFNSQSLKKNFKTSSGLGQEYDCSLYCESLEDSLKNLEFNIPEIKNLSVSKFGEKVYLTTRDIFPNGDRYYNSELRSPVKRAFIFTIDNKKNVSILKVNGTPPLSCHLQKTLAVDDNDNLFLVSEKDKLNPTGIYRINYTNESLEPYISRGLDFNSKINHDNENIYFINFGGGYKEREKFVEPFSLNKSNKISKIIGRVFYDDLVSESNYQYDKLRYTLFNNKVFLNVEQVFPGSSLGTSAPGFISSGLKISTKIVEFISQAETKKTYKSVINLVDEGKIGNIADMKANSKGEIIVSDDKKHCLWKVIPYQSVTLLAGKENSPGFSDAKADSAQFNNPKFVDIDAADNIYVADIGNNAIRKITPDGIVSTFYSQALAIVKVKP